MSHQSGCTPASFRHLPSASSKARLFHSWVAELSDYISMIGFFAVAHVHPTVFTEDKFPVAQSPSLSCSQAMLPLAPAARARGQAVPLTGGSSRSSAPGATPSCPRVREAAHCRDQWCEAPSSWQSPRCRSTNLDGNFTARCPRVRAKCN